LLPVTFTLNPTSALIMLAGIYYGAQYGSTDSREYSRRVLRW
jgi:putative tricarboxylic transport membrane protein